MSKVTQDELIRHMLGELGEEGGSRVDEAVASQPATAAQLAGFCDAMAAFALASSPPREARPELRDQILAEVDAPAAGSPGEPLPRGTTRATVVLLLPWLAAACFALVAGLSLLSWRSQREALLSENAELRGQVAASDLRVRELASQVDESFKAFIVWDDSRATGVLKVENLPALGDGEDYQLWVVSEGYEHPLDGGVFDTEDGKAELKIVTRQLAKDPATAERVSQFAISRERAGGVPISETKDFVLAAAY